VSWFAVYLRIAAHNHSLHGRVSAPSAERISTMAGSVAFLTKEPDYLIGAFIATSLTDSEEAIHMSGKSANRTSGIRSPLKRGISVNSTNALPCFDFFGCDCGHLARSVDLVASLLVNLGFCRIRFWYSVAPGSGISRKNSRTYIWILTPAKRNCNRLSTRCFAKRSPAVMARAGTGAREELGPYNSCSQCTVGDPFIDLIGSFIDLN
jgi:hypothetical protein